MITYSPTMVEMESFIVDIISSVVIIAKMWIPWQAKSFLKGSNSVKFRPAQLYQENSSAL